eukprot:TRINITY_DN6728_c0_g1_i1.p1 TRINITY_DN6728_c0_g1~~TRINITY_DN6728_c0_g1_i1.p1  ORF type:complete len:458 (+),score=34.89 TRINITY_DN6728_c0_g1_i1:63-1436(+)
MRILWAIMVVMLLISNCCALESLVQKYTFELGQTRIKSIGMSDEILAFGSDTKDSTGKVNVFYGGIDYETEHSDHQSNNMFGSAIAVDGIVIAVGAWGHNNNVGTVSMLLMNETFLIQQDGINPEDGETGDMFGCSVALNPEWLFVGSCGARGTSGLVYIYYKRSGPFSWVLSQILSPDEIESGTHFGSSMSIFNNTLVVGAYGERGIGSVYVFEKHADSTGKSPGTWLRVSKMLSPSESNMEFGRSVTVVGTSLLVAAPGISNEDEGIVYHFSYVKNADDWILSDFISSVKDVNKFGSSISFDGENAIIGCIESGIVHVFSRKNQTWNNTHILVPYDEENVSGFGEVVAIFGSNIVVGAYDKEYHNASIYMGYSKCDNHRNPPNCDLEDIAPSPQIVSTNVPTSHPRDRSSPSHIPSNHNQSANTASWTDKLASDPKWYALIGLVPFLILLITVCI